MKLPLSVQILHTLQRGCRQLSDEAFASVTSYVRSQRGVGEAFCNRAGQSDLYYTFFGWMLCYVLHLPSDSRQRSAMLEQVDRGKLDDLHFTVLELCMQLHRVMDSGVLGWRPSVERLFAQFLDRYQQHGSRTGVNAWAVSLTRRRDDGLLRQIQALQHPSGGFLAHSQAPMPDLLSTAVALFTLSLHRVAPAVDSAPFIYAHWLHDGGFAPTLFDHQSDVEYVFYGLLAIGALRTDDKKTQ